MKKGNYKIKAFTLTELMVVIVISTIVVGLAFSVLRIVQNNMRSISKNYESREQIQSLETALTIDFNRFTSIQWDPSKNVLTASSPIEERVYQIFNDSIITNMESYIVAVKEKKFYFEGTPVNSGAIDAMKLTFDNTRELHRLFVFKYNDPTIHF
ncbi:prepilin-type N-terminal cleavage/methylation domain-containing protein [Aquimarina longa]|uniref:prepilin-type N-terminal cleavage/methylation domain-containing protein n=1 Tax=Aquimarina longa TaxID=1080221 RepID=UPI000780B37C|nr:prepilin-type N-terminal cleavage/methylation domain-containing protein [Aquimarina longa]